MRRLGSYLAVAGGVLLVGVGIVMLRLAPEAQGVLMVLAYVCIGVGCGAFGHGMGTILSRWAVKGHPDVQRQLAIEQTDERNVTITNRAKAKAFDIMLFVFGALMLSFALMEVALPAILLLVAAYLFVVGCQIYYISKYQREM